MNEKDFIIASGERVMVSAVLVNGKYPVLDFLEEISALEKKKALHLIKFAAEFHPISNTEKFKIVERDLYELKPTNQIRIFCFQRGKKLLLTNGCRKKTDKLDPEDIKKTRRIKEYFDKR